MRRYLIYLFYFLIAALTVSWQLVSINSWAPGYNHLNIVLILVLVFWLSLDWKKGVLMAAACGLIMDFLSFEFFGAYTLSLVLTVVLVDFLSVNWLTNRSFYSLWFLSLLGVGIYNFSLYLIFYLGRSTANRYFFLANGNFWLGLAWELVWAASIIFFFLVFFGSKIPKLRPVFLERK
ncbi:MAG TPA: hypothetical protein PKI61_03415 [bacterium]|nr:hypothetical protein [bacterium]HPT30103.1 hypothetical protein [bacterium]